MHLQIPTNMQPLQLYNGFDQRPVSQTAQFDVPPFEPFAAHNSPFQSSFGLDRMNDSTGNDVAHHGLMQGSPSPVSPPSTKTKDNPPKEKQRRNRKRKPPLPEAAQLAKRRANLDKNKKAAAKCRAKKKVVEEKQSEKLRSMKLRNKELHGTVLSLFQRFDQVEGLIAHEEECTKTADDIRHVVQGIEMMKQRYYEQSAEFEEKLKNTRSFDRSEEADNLPRSGSEFSNAGFETHFVGGDQDEMQQGSYSQMPAFSAAKDNYNSFMAGVGLPESQDPLESVNSRENTVFGVSGASLSSPSMDNMFQSNPYATSPTFNTRFENFMPSYPTSTDNLYQPPFFDSPTNPSFDNMETSFLQTSMNAPEIEAQSQKDSAYGSPETKDQVLPILDQQDISGSAADPKADLAMRRDSALGMDLNKPLFAENPQINQGFLNLNIRGQGQPQNLFERRKLRSEAQRNSFS